MTGALRVDVEVPGRLRAAFEVEPGSVVAVLGPNGAGKSTLLHAVAGLLGAVGTVRVGTAEWQNHRSASPAWQRAVAMCFQGQHLFPHLSAVDNVAFGVRCRGRSAKQAREIATGWLTRFGVGDLARRRPGELSGGQAQRVALARAMATEPEVLLLDEPFTGLDLGVAQTLRADLAEHLRSFAGVTLLVTHDRVDAAVLADRALVLDHGAIAQFDGIDAVAACPQTEHVAHLVGVNRIVDGRDLITFAPSAVVVSRDQPSGSARLRWHATVASQVGHGDLVRLSARTDPGQLILADITLDSAVELRCEVGAEVWLAVKETAVRRQVGAARLPE